MNHFVAYLSGRWAYYLNKDGRIGKNRVSYALGVQRSSPQHLEETIIAGYPNRPLNLIAGADDPSDTSYTSHCEIYESADQDELPPDELHIITNLRFTSQSRQNFAWKLVRHYFTDYELRDHNCYGRKGKKALSQDKLSKIYHLVFRYFPVEEPAMKERAWRECTIAVDKGIRNTFCDYTARFKPGMI